jgi:hypothetical protein
MRTLTVSRCNFLCSFAAIAALWMVWVPVQAQGVYEASAEGRAAEQQGLAAAKLSDFKQARAHFLDARTADPYWPDNLYYLGLATSKLPGMELQAAAWFEAYLALDPKSPRAEEIRTTIKELVETGRAHAAVLVGSMERMAAAFPPDQVDAFKAHSALLADELALLELAHRPGDYDMEANGEWPALHGDTSKAWEAAQWMATNGNAPKEQLAQEFADWGRVELSLRILGQDEHGSDWIPYVPQLIGGDFLDEISARTMFRPADFLGGIQLPTNTMCAGLVAFAQRQIVINQTYNRREAMDSVNECGRAVVQAPDGQFAQEFNPVLGDVIEFYLVDGNVAAAWAIYKKMKEPSYFAGMVSVLIAANQDLANGKPGAKNEIDDAIEGVKRSRGMEEPAVAAVAVAACEKCNTQDPQKQYQIEKNAEEGETWKIAATPAEFVGRVGPAVAGAIVSSRDAADEWETLATENLSGDWFVDYQNQLNALRNYSSPDAIDKAGAVYSACADAAKTLLDGLTAVTVYQRSILIYRAPATPLPPTWKQTAAAKK